MIIYAMHTWKWIGQHIIKTVVYKYILAVSKTGFDMANKFIANETWYKYGFSVYFIYIKRKRNNVQKKIALQRNNDRTIYMCALCGVWMLDA